MTRYLRFLILFFFIFSVTYAVEAFVERSSPRLAVLHHIIDRVQPIEPFTYVAVGDVMLGRTVRDRMRANGNNTPFANVGLIFLDADAVVANLEGPITTLDAPDERISPEHPFSMRFAFDPIAADVLRNAGVTHVSLANNHSGDQGREGKEHTYQYLASAGVGYFGFDNITRVDSEGRDITFVGIDATMAPPNLEKLSNEITNLGTDTHVVAFIHWGDEYQPVHNATQEKIAHALIDAGVDAIIGSHPHVIQDIEVYNDAPIFYSLGNFIFDQYWNADVRNGLALRITHDDEGERYQIVPIDGNHAQPKLMDEPARQELLDALALRSQAALAESIKAGLIVI